MEYQVGNYKFKTPQEMQAAKRDLQKIQLLKRPTGTPKEMAVSYLRQIKARNIKFETAIGRDFLKAQADKLNDGTKPVSGDKNRFYGDPKKEKKEARKKYRRENGFRARPTWQKVSLIMLGAALATLLTLLSHELYCDFISRSNVKELQEVATAEEVEEITFDESQEEALAASGVQVLSWDGKEILPQYKKLVLQNPDFAGWVSIAGTAVDYPVMHRPDDNDFYLSHNFDGDYDVNGLLVLDKRCSVDGTDDNVLIHGHNMKSGFMFGALKNYKDYNYYHNHPTIKFNSLYQENTYDIIAVFLSSVDESENDFRYYDFINIYNEAEFEAYIRGIKEKSLYEIPYTAMYGDHLITLSTCDYSKRDGRLVIVGRKRFV
ncbi:MAG: class B sortase [Lachnospiraceae bacterium]|nr:class B sortase [Lachnospiraceae bacterium]